MSSTSVLVFRLVLFAQLLCCVVSASSNDAESGALFFRSYPPKTYHATPQNWAAVQDRLGVMYFGNNDGVLQYDGQKWRKLQLPNSSTVRSLAVGADGTVYVGGQTEFGFLKPNATATLEYVSLLSRVPPNDRRFGDVWTTMITTSGVVFSSFDRLFRWSPERGMQVWRSPSAFSIAFLLDDTPYVLQRGSGLYRLVGDSLQPVPGAEALSKATALRGIFHFAGSTMLATPEALFVEKNGSFEAYPSEAQALLRDAKISTCLPLPDGSLAVGTLHRGVLFFSPQGKLWRIGESADYGLHGSSINGMYCDREGGLWLALNNGLARLDTSGPATHFTQSQGLQELVLSIQRYNGVLYAGTMDGLYRLSVVSSGSARFTPVSEISGQVPALLSTGHGLLAGTSFGLSQITDDGVVEISRHGGIMGLAASRTDPAVVYGGGRRGLYEFRLENGAWQQTKFIDTGGQRVISLAQDLAGAIWASTVSDIWRFDLSSNPAKIDRFSRLQGVPLGWKTICSLPETTVFATLIGLFHFDAVSRRFKPDSAFESALFPNERPMSAVYQSPDRDIWITGENFHGVLHRTASGKYTWQENVLANLGLKELYGLYVEPDHIIWASGLDGGLVRFDPQRTSTRQTDFHVLLRQVQVVGRETTIFGGAAPLVRTPKLPYRDNALHFEFAAPLFEGASEVEYRVFLQGLGRTWSPWTSQSEKEYTNIWEGNYAFHVQARDSQGRLSREAIFHFAVHPPLYRQWWAYTLYAILALCLIWLLVRWRLLAVEAQNRKLESIVEQRTDEVRRQRDEIKLHEEETENLLLNILPAPVAEELRTTGSVTPICCDNITVCFTDFVKFTLSTESISPEELVDALNRYFSEFDRIVESYGLEKIKTIGDAYMFVSGLPGSKPSHAVDAVLAALEIVAAVERLSSVSPGWEIRVGLHSGPAVAGVVGLRKFAFDIWGETVNYASRHESSGQPNAVNISRQTYELVADFFQCKSRGPVLIKEGRSPEMYIAECVHLDLCRPLVAGDGYLFEELYYRRFSTPPPKVPDLKKLAAAV